MKTASLLTLLLLASFARAADERVVLPGTGTTVLGPDDTLEFVLRDVAAPVEAARAAPQVRAWLLKANAPAPVENNAPNGRAFVTASPTRPGEFIVHLRGLSSTEKGALDLLLRWDTPGGAFKGEARIVGAVAFKESLPDVTLVIDCSLSMELSDPQRQRVEAARKFIELARSSGGIGRVGIIVFSDKVKRLLPLTAIDDSAAFAKAFEEIRENGLTDINGSILEAVATLRDDTGTASGAIVLLTDGKQEPGEYANAHLKAKEAAVPVHTIGLGKGADLALLKRIAEETGGTCSDAQRGEDLLKLYATIAGRIAGGRTVFSAPLAGNGEAEIPVDGACRSLLARMTSAGELRVSTADANDSTGLGDHPLIFRSQPAVGTWRLQWLPSERDGAQKGLVEASARTPLYPLFFRARPEPAASVEIDPDDPRMLLSLAETAEPLNGAVVSIELELPDKRVLKFGLSRDADGVYAGTLAEDFSKLPLDAAGTLKAIVTGKRANGDAFRREVHSTWSLRQSGMRGIVAAPIDFGDRWSGTEASSSTALKLRGPGGPLAVTILETVRAQRVEQQRRETIKLTIKKAPGELQPRQAASLDLDLAIAPNAPEGAWGGEIELEIPARGNTPETTLHVPWRVNVRKPILVAEPAELDLGALRPGESVVKKVRVRTLGGRVAVSGLNAPDFRMNAPDWRARLFGYPSSELPSRAPMNLKVLTFPQQVDEKGAEAELRFSASADATRQSYSFPVRVEGGSGVVLTIPVRVKILPAWIEDTPPTLPASEPGDAVSFTVPLAAKNFAPGEISAQLEGEERELQSKVIADAKGVVFSFTVPADTPDGALGVSTSVQAGPALLLRRYETQVIAPQLGVSVGALDLGSLYAGQSRELEFEVSFKGARPTDLKYTLQAAPAKPNLGHIRLPEEVLKLSSSPAQLAPGESSTLSLALNVPGTCQDGVYKTSVLLDTRLGRRSLPVSFRVISPIPLPPFHIAPTEIVLRVIDGEPPMPATITISSHLDTELPVRVTLKAGESYTRPSAELLRVKGSTAEDSLSLLVPARGETAFLTRALPDVADGEFCSILVEGGGERQQVDVRVERFRARASVGPKENAERSFMNWLALLVILLLILLILLIRALVKKRWVRYAAYAIAVHAAFMFIAVPTQKIVGALPESVQLTLLKSQEELGFELSPEQMRRLEELQAAAAEPKERAPEKPEISALADAGGSELNELKTEPGPSGAPQAQAELAPADTKESQPAADAPEARRADARALADAALSADEAPQIPRPAEPAPAKPDVAAAPVVAHVPVTTQDRPELPFADEVTEVLPQPTLQKADAAPSALKSENFETVATPEAAAAQRPTREAPSREDLPLMADAPEPVQKKTAPATQSASSQVAAPDQPHSHNVAQNLKSTLPIQSGTTSREVMARSAAPTQAAQTHVGAWKPANGQTLGDGGKGTASTLHASTRREAGSLHGTADTALDAGSAPAVTVGGAKSGGKTGDTGAGQTPNARGTGGTATVGTGTAPGKGAAPDGGISQGGPGGSGLAPAAMPGTGKGAGIGKLEGGGLTDGKGLGGDGVAMASIGTGRGSTAAGAGDAPLDAGGLGKIPGQGTGAESKPQNGKGADGARDGPVGTGALTGIGAGGTGGALAKLEGKNTLSGAPAISETRAKLPSTPGVLRSERHSSDIGSLSGGGKGLASHRPLWGPSSANALKITLGLARHNGDWDSSPTALFHLATSFKGRCGLPEVDTKVKTASLVDVTAVRDCQVVLVTSNKPIVFTEAEIESMRKYIEGGGTLWFNDSGASGDERFDQALRRDLLRIFPKGKLEALPQDHALFSAAYDLKTGYKGYRVPPGDKYRQEFIEGVVIEGKGGARLGLIYTRNDYADGLEIDPRNIAGRMSLTDLTSEEMLEGSVRFGINLVAYALGSNAPQMPPPPESAAEFEKTYRYNGPALKPFEDFAEAKDAEGKAIWQAEEWANPTSFEYVADGEQRLLKVTFKGGDKMKAAVGRSVNLDLTNAKSVVVDLHSSLRHGFNVSLLMSSMPDWQGFESRPVFVRPGWNRNLRFPLDRDDFKSAKSEWKTYDSAFKPRDHVARLAVLLYNLEEDGEVKIGSIRVEK
ncbi:MAG TPA: DUF4159 domain-containing protein [Planctomycetota bacterium]|nr:DUF4159 domain-containing protein [Planctomycetota bacterium]